MLILRMGIAQAQALMLHLPSPAASQRPTGRLTTYPLLTTRGLHERRMRIATDATMLASHRLGFHAVVCHGIPLCGAVAAPSALLRQGAVPPAPNRSRR
jgi:hypothetical protein